MKRGGQIIYGGPLGQHSQNLVEYFEVSMISALPIYDFLKRVSCKQSSKNFCNHFQAIPGVPRIKEGYNPATWMLEISSPAIESQLGVDYAELYTKSELYQ